MPSSGVTRANENKRIRQEALREQLAGQKHVEHVVEYARKLADLDKELDGLAIQRLRAAAEIKKNLIDKYLPSLKATDLSVSDADGNPLNFNFSMVLQKD